jgi:hypothetical protein
MTDYKTDAKISRHAKLHKMGAMEREARKPDSTRDRKPDASR